MTTDDLVQRIKELDRLDIELAEATVRYWIDEDDREKFGAMMRIHGRYTRKRRELDRAMGWWEAGIDEAIRSFGEAA